MNVMDILPDTGWKLFLWLSIWWPAWGAVIYLYLRFRKPRHPIYFGVGEPPSEIPPDVKEWFQKIHLRGEMERNHTKVHPS